MTPVGGADIRVAESIDLLGSLVPESVQVVVADPPYGIAYHSNRYVDRNPHTPVAHDWNFQIGPFMNRVASVLRPGGAVYLFTRWDVYPLWITQVAPPLESANLIVWKKDAHSAGDLTGNFGNQYELIMFLVKGRHRRRGHRWSNVWEFPRIPARRLRVATEKPRDLVARAIEASSDAGDLIVDPFVGSGTTADAAVALGRRCICGDIDPAMVAMACSRIGLPVPLDVRVSPASLSSPCPVFGIEPPAPHLWGVHPEDLARALGMEAASTAATADGNGID